MADRARWIRPVLLQPLAERRGGDILRLFAQDRHIGRWRWWRGPKNLFQDKFPSLYGGCARGHRREREHAGHPHHAATFSAGQAHALKLRAADALDSVMLREPLIDEAVVGPEEIEN